MCEPLAPYHVSDYLNAYARHFYSLSDFSKLIFNRYTLPIFEKILNAGLRIFFRGQSIYTQFYKL